MNVFRLSPRGLELAVAQFDALEADDELTEPQAFERHLASILLGHHDGPLLADARCSTWASFERMALVRQACAIRMREMTCN